MSELKHPMQLLYQGVSATLTTVLLFIWPTLLNAQEAAARKPYPGLNSDPLQSLQLSNYLIGIVAVFVTLGIVSWLVRRYQPKIGRGQIRVEAYLSLGGKEKLMLVEVEARRLLIGVSPAGISLLQDLSNATQEATEQLAETPPVDTPSNSWLQQTLKSVTRS